MRPEHNFTPGESLSEADKDINFREFVQGTICSELSEKAVKTFALRLCVTEEQLVQEIAAQKEGGKSHG